MGSASAASCQLRLLEALLEALPVLVLALSPEDAQSAEGSGAALERGNGVEALVSVVLRAGASAGGAGVLTVLRLPALLAPHVGEILAHSGVRQLWRIVLCMIATHREGYGYVFVIEL